MLATEYAKYYKIDKQQEDEDDLVFRSRVAGVLRDMGHIIEAHEAQQNAHHDESNQVMTGVFGAIAQAFHGIDYNRSGEQQVGDDIAVGAVMQNPIQMSPTEAIKLFG